MAAIAITLLAVGVIGALGKLYIPSAGLWTLFTAGTMATVVSIMCLRFHYNNIN